MSFEWKTHLIPLTHSIDGQAVELHKFTLDSGKSGPHLYLQSGVHGAELQGHLVIQELIKHAPTLLDCGKITCIPCANPLGLNHKIGESTAGRFHPVSRENWNRNYLEIPSDEIKDLWNWEHILDQINHENWIHSFRQYCSDVLRKKLEIQKRTYQLSMAKKLAWTLQLEALQADLMLDLHTGPRATRYVYSVDFCKEKCVDLGLPHAIIIPPIFDGAMDEACFMPWVHLKNKLQEKGQQIDIPVESYTLELGDEETICTKSAINDLAGILHFMMRRGMILKQNLSAWLETIPFLEQDEDRFEANLASTLDQFTSYRAPQSGLIEYFVQPGELIEARQPLFQIHRPTDPLNHSIEIVESDQSGIVINICTSSAVTEGMRLIDILHNPFSIKANPN